MTRKALDLIRQSYKNSAEFMKSQFGDDDFKYKLHILVHDLQDLHREYSHCQSEHSKGQASMMTWAAERAFGKIYMGTVKRMMERLVHSDLQELVCLMPCGQVPIGSLLTNIYIYYNIYYFFRDHLI